MLERLELLIGKDKVNMLKSKTVLVIGLGGVGSFALEALVRSGIGNLIIVDSDNIDITNLNRQLMTNHTNIGKSKVEVWLNRIKDINPECLVNVINEFITKDNIEKLFSKKVDYVIDAIDTIETKKEIIKECLKRKVKFITSMGTGNKLDPSKLEIVDIRKTSYDPIAKIIRKMVKDLQIKDKIMVVCSKEEPIKTNSKTIGSNSYVPASAGILCASYVINDIIGDSNDRRD